MWRILGKFLYDLILQLIVTTWAEYISRFQKQGREVADAFINGIYPWSSIVLISITLISCFLYYFYFNNKFGKYYTPRSWFKWMFFTSITVGVFTFFVGNHFVSSFLSPTMLLIVWQSIINLIYAFFLFILLSIIFQIIAILIRKLFSYDLSPMGSRTPF